jgi:hypothetical protein
MRLKREMMNLESFCCPVSWITTSKRKSDASCQIPHKPDNNIDKTSRREVVTFLVSLFLESRCFLFRLEVSRIEKESISQKNKISLSGFVLKSVMMTTSFTECDATSSIDVGFNLCFKLETHLLLQPDHHQRQGG